MQGLSESFIRGKEMQYERAPESQKQQETDFKGALQVKKRLFDRGYSITAVCFSK